MSSTVRDFNRKVNNLLADFSFVNSNTLSALFDSYCMFIYGSQLFKLYDKNSVNCIYVAWRKAIRKVGKIAIFLTAVYCPILMIVITLIIFFGKKVYTIFEQYIQQ